jgi:hypothetical protein
MAAVLRLSLTFKLMAISKHTFEVRHMNFVMEMITNVPRPYV